MADSKAIRGIVKSVQRKNGKLVVEVAADHPDGLMQRVPAADASSGGGGRTVPPVYNHVFEVDDNPSNRQTFHIGANVAHGWWPALSVLEAAGMV